MTITKKFAFPTWAITAPDFTAAHALVYVNGFIWGLTQTQPSNLFKIDPTNTKQFTVLAFPADGLHDNGMQLVYSSTKARIYALFGTTNSVNITEIDPITLQTVDVIADGANRCGRGSLDLDSTYLYVCTFVDNPSQVVRYRLSDFGRVSALTMPTGDSVAHDIRVDGTKIYVTSNQGFPAWLARINAATFTVEQVASLPANFYATDDMGVDANYLWIGSESTGQVARALKTDLTQQQIIDPGVGAVACFGVGSDGTYIWAVYNTVPGQIVRINPADLSSQIYVLPIGQNSPNEMVFSGDNLFFSTWTTSTIASVPSPGTVGVIAKSLL